VLAIVVGTEDRASLLSFRMELIRNIHYVIGHNSRPAARFRSFSRVSRQCVLAGKSDSQIEVTNESKMNLYYIRLLASVRMNGGHPIDRTIFY
jgi:hypothetical protein